MQLFHSPLSNKHSLGCTCVLILPLNAEEELSVSWLPWSGLSAFGNSKSLFIWISQLNGSWVSNSVCVWGGVIEQSQTWKRWEIEDPHHDRRANLTSRTILETSPRLPKNKNDLSVFLWLVAGSRVWGFFRMAADHGHWTWPAQQVCELSEVTKAFWIHPLHSEFAWRTPRALCLCSTLQQRVKLQLSCLSHLTWLDSLDNEDRKDYNCETLEKPGTYHMMKVEIIGNRCSKFSVTPPSPFFLGGLPICSFKVQKKSCFFLFYLLFKPFKIMYISTILMPYVPLFFVWFVFYLCPIEEIMF